MSFKCVRCGKPVSSKGARCESCLAKLRRNKKDPKRHEHVSKLISDAHRREKGGAGHTKKSKGLGDTEKMKRKIKDGYKKNGTSTTLSMDRINNNEGYSNKNVRMVPKKLNRGRHHIDPKKLAEWKKKVKKSNVDPDDLQKAIVLNTYNAGLPDIAIAIESTDFIKKILSK